MFQKTGARPRFFGARLLSRSRLAIIICVMDRKFVFSVDEYYHIYQRGIEKRKVFLDHGDYWRFLSLLYLSNADPAIHRSDFSSKDKTSIFSKTRSKLLVAIGAYCLMPNHFHLLVREITDGGISRFMQKLITGYTMYFNKKHQRSGALFGGPFGAQHVDNDVYLRYLYAYIHLNPVKIVDPESWAGKRIVNVKSAKNFLDNYRYSSFPFYIRGRGEVDKNRVEDAVLSHELFPGYFSRPRDFSDFINDWVSMHDSNVKARP